MTDSVTTNSGVTVKRPRLFHKFYRLSGLSMMEYRGMRPVSRLAVFFGEVFGELAGLLPSDVIVCVCVVYLFLISFSFYQAIRPLSRRLSISICISVSVSLLTVKRLLLWFLFYALCLDKCILAVL